MSFLHFFLVVVACGGGFFSSASAQEGADQKRALVLEFFEFKPPRALIDASIEAIASNRYTKKDPAREEFVSRMQLAVDYDRIEEMTLQAMMELYTVEELRAMVGYYGSEEGRSAEEKAVELRSKIAPELKKMLDLGVLNVVTTPSPAESSRTP